MNIFYSFQQVGVTVIISTHELPITPIKHKKIHLNSGELKDQTNHVQLLS